jgi:hypothetical protein
MHAYIRETRRGLFEGVWTPSNASTHLCDPPLPAFCTDTKLAPLGAPITHGNLQHDLPTEEPLLLNTSLSREPREGCAAIVSPQGKQGGLRGSSGQPAYRHSHLSIH